jgi:dihydroorotate dehydrogenase
MASELGIPIQCKFNATMLVKTVCEAANHPACDAITVSNTIPWGALPDRINWVGLFGTTKSPLHKIGGGGLSGSPLLPLVCEWIDAARSYNFRKPIWACGGIDSVRAVQMVKVAGASGIQLGTVAITRPWRMKSIIACGNELFI